MRIITKSGTDIPYEPMAFGVEPVGGWNKETGKHDYYRVVARSAYCDIGKIVVIECETRDEAIKVIARMAHAASTKGTTVTPCVSDVATKEIERLNTMRGLEL